MHIAYSAYRNNYNNKIKAKARKQPAPQGYRLEGYLAACQKHRETIREIRQYFPGWEPPFLTGS